MATKKKYIEGLLEKINSKYLYLIEFYNGPSLYVIGKNLKSALEEVDLKTELNIKYSTVIEDFNHLLKVEKDVKKDVINNRKVYITKNFECMYEDFNNKYWFCTNTQTGQQIKLPELN